MHLTDKQNLTGCGDKGFRRQCQTPSPGDSLRSDPEGVCGFDRHAPAAGRSLATSLVLSAVELTHLPPQIYIIGGSDADGNHLALVTAYDAVLDERVNLTDMPQPRAHFAIATDNSTIWVVGGYSADSDEDNSTPGGCILAYNVAADSWSAGPCMQTPRADACASFIAGKLYVAGKPLCLPATDKPWWLAMSGWPQPTELTPC